MNSRANSRAANLNLEARASALKQSVRICKDESTSTRAAVALSWSDAYSREVSVSGTFVEWVGVFRFSRSIMAVCASSLNLLPTSIIAT